MVTKSMLASLGPLISSKFLTRGKKGIRVGAVVEIREVMTGEVVMALDVILVLETTTGMTVVAHDGMTGVVTVTVIQDVVDGMEAVTLVEEEMTVSHSKF